MKLIRDHIPGIPDEVWETVSDEEAYKLLKAKLFEEVEELAETDFTDLQEFADVQEVLNDLIRKAKFRLSDVEVARITKLKSHGGFSNKVLVP